MEIMQCRYINVIEDLHRVNLLELSHNEKMAFFLNLYNAMVIHGLIRFGRLDGVIDRKSFFSDFQYLVGGHPYSLIAIKNGILRGNRRPPYSFVKPFSNVDKRLEVNFILSSQLLRIDYDLFFFNLRLIPFHSTFDTFVLILFH